MHLETNCGTSLMNKWEAWSVLVTCSVVDRRMGF